MNASQLSTLFLTQIHNNLIASVVIAIDKSAKTEFSKEDLVTMIRDMKMEEVEVTAPATAAPVTKKVTPDTGDNTPTATSKKPSSRTSTTSTSKKASGVRQYAPDLGDYKCRHIVPKTGEACGSTANFQTTPDGIRICGTHKKGIEFEDAPKAPTSTGGRGGKKGAKVDTEEASPGLSSDLTSAIINKLMSKTLSEYEQADSNNTPSTVEED